MSEKLFTAMPVGMKQAMACVFIGQIRTLYVHGTAVLYVSLS
jgi:hypothetical protein